LKDPEYTGENRCRPCTAVNLLIAAGASAVAWVLTPLAAVAVAAASLSAIYLKGYLVPGTPTLTKRYLPERVLRLFDKAPSQSREDVDVRRFLLDAGVVREGGSDLELDPGFEAAWRDCTAAELTDGDERERLADLLGVGVDDLEVVDHGDAFVVRSDGLRVGQWESRPAFAADMAAADVLDARCLAWSSLSMGARSEVLGALRLFLERCPACDAPVTLDREVVESCCRSIDVVAATCQGCGARLFESPFDPDAVDDGAPDHETGGSAPASTAG
jgi:hypothetical protein